ncbi:hypothetical protein QO033_14880 [Pseudodonghicola sp. IC7]|uniref:Twin-arginine translocation signal domain-containing protein n=1 Tax=Pseudodonghicola flavimaris TaxID=3050036 RepID=A0ABT7F2Z1_9RHOB|nr:hypothetical protein [Pseudodonghicola flavimaris]MDK3018966.1 hypothetical protein [Pseudodonghicola flavimaris]
MCDLCVIETVKDRMMSRRGFPGAGLGGGAAAPALQAGHDTARCMT